MGTKRKTYRIREGDYLETEEYHDGRYGAPGGKRQKKKKPTEEQMREANQRSKERRTRQRLLSYFQSGDCFATLTYAVANRPQDMETALKDFQKTMRKIRKEYKKEGKELFWIRNIEQGTKGAWHIHVVINEIGDTASIIKKAWEKGGIYLETIGGRKDETFTKLANYITKDEHTRKKKENGEKEKPRIRQANYGTSRNMPLPEPKIEKLKRWPKEPKQKKGYYIAEIYEGINPVTGYKYRRYLQVKIERRRKDGSGNLHRDGYDVESGMPPGIRICPGV